MRMLMLQALVEALSGSEQVLAFWEQGSVAMGRADQWSDLDLYAIVRPGAVPTVQALAEKALSRVAPIDLRFLVPQPAWHGHWQGFYRLAGADPLHQVDLLLMEEGAANLFLEPEIHGRAVVLFDRQGLVRQEPTDAVAFAGRLARRLELLEVPAELFHPFVGKELNRGRPVDGLHFYQGVLIARLVEALRMRYSPWRYNFGLRYLQADLPPTVYGQVEHLVYVGSPAELPAKKEEALALLRETLAWLKQADLVALLETNR